MFKSCLWRNFLVRARKADIKQQCCTATLKSNYNWTLLPTCTLKFPQVSNGCSELVSGSVTGAAWAARHPKVQLWNNWFEIAQLKLSLWNVIPCNDSLKERDSVCVCECVSCACVRVCVHVSEWVGEVVTEREWERKVLRVDDTFAVFHLIKPDGERQH